MRDARPGCVPPLAGASPLCYRRLTRMAESTQKQPTRPARTATGGWDGAAVYARAADVILRSIAGESLLVPIRSGVADLQAVFTLNPVGVAIWERLDGAASLDAVLAALLERFEVSPETARDDLVSFIGRLGDERLVERRS